MPQHACAGASAAWWVPGPDSTFKIPRLLSHLALCSPGVSDPTCVPHLSQMHFCLLSFPMSSLGLALLAPIISHPSDHCTLHPAGAELWLLVQALRHVLGPRRPPRAAGEAWGGNGGAAGRPRGLCQVALRDS